MNVVLIYLFIFINLLTTAKMYEINTKTVVCERYFPIKLP